MMHAAATPHNTQPRDTDVTIYNNQGELVSRSNIVLASHEDIEKYAIGLFKNYFRITNRNLVSKDSTFDDHGLDELDAVELVVRMEDELGYVVPGEALRCFKSVKNFVNYIKQTEDFKREFNKDPIN
jgi:acyl carrier protein